MTAQLPAEIQTARRYLAGWRGVFVLATVALVAGLALGWSWLVAAGIAPILISVLPCLAMCALGLCMNRRAGHSCSTEDAKTIDMAVDTTPPAKLLELRPHRPAIGARALPREGE